ncbi:hypothetical protein ACFXDE_19290 [Kitasatospora sp. NPDC059408]|uniref:hypothetical protein n=1 Tax=Kitasatospora sp. NPDC059408 TaxID=3346823 RepID=UPI00368B871A
MPADACEADRRLLAEPVATADVVRAGSKQDSAGGDTVERRSGAKGLQECKRLVELIIFFGGALAGLILFGEVARDSFAESTQWLRAAFVAAVIVAAVLMGSARLSVEWFIRKCDRGQVEDPENDAPQRPFRYYEIGTVVTGIAGMILLFAAGWAAVAPAHPQELTVIDRSSSIPSPPAQHRREF